MLVAEAILVVGAQALPPAVGPDRAAATIHELAALVAPSGNSRGGALRISMAYLAKTCVRAMERIFSVAENQKRARG